MGTRLLPCIALAVLVLCGEAAAAGRASVAEELSAADARLRAAMRQLAAGNPGPFGTNDAFCEALDGRPDVPALWRRIVGRDAAPPRGRGGLAAALVARVVACEFSSGSAYRAADLLDYAHGNGLLDTLGESLEQALRARSMIVELWALSEASRQLERSLAITREGATAAPATFLDLPRARGGPLLQLGKAAAAFSNEKRAVVGAMIEALDLRDGQAVLFAEDTLDLLRSPEDLAAVDEWFASLEDFRARRDLLGTPHGGWRRLLDAVRGDERRAVRILGALTALHLWPLQFVGRSLADTGRLSPEMARALYQGSTAFFLMNELDELSARPSPRSTSVAYHFFYPPGFESDNWKTYHFFANAYLGCKLSRKGFGRDAIHFGIRTLAQAYELIHLERDAAQRRAMEANFRANVILDSASDVDLNTAGGDFGASLCPR